MCPYQWATHSFILLSLCTVPTPFATTQTDTYRYTQEPSEPDDVHISNWTRVLVLLVYLKTSIVIGLSIVHTSRPHCVFYLGYSIDVDGTKTKTIITGDTKSIHKQNKQKGL